MACKDTAYNRMYGKVARMSNEDLYTIWQALSDPKAWHGEMYGEGIPLTDWAQAIDTEMSRRGLPKD